MGTPTPAPAPDPCLTPSQLRMLAAVCGVWDRDGRVTHRALRDALGLYPQSVFATLRILRRKGFVGFEDGRYGTIRPLWRVGVFPEALARRAS